MPKTIAQVDWQKVKNLTELDDLAQELFNRYDWFSEDMLKAVNNHCENAIAVELDIVIPAFA